MSADTSEQKGFHVVLLFPHPGLFPFLPILYLPTFIPTFPHYTCSPLYIILNTVSVLSIFFTPPPFRGLLLIPNAVGEMRSVPWEPLWSEIRLEVLSLYFTGFPQHTV